MQHIIIIIFGFWLSVGFQDRDSYRLNRLDNIIIATNMSTHTWRMEERSVTTNICHFSRIVVVLQGRVSYRLNRQVSIIVETFTSTHTLRMEERSFTT